MQGMVAPRVVFGTLTPDLFPEFCVGGVILPGAIKQLMEFFELLTEFSRGVRGKRDAHENPGAQGKPSAAQGGNGDEARGGERGVDHPGAGRTVPEGGAGPAVKQPRHRALKDGQQREGRETQPGSGTDGQHGAFDGGKVGEWLAEIIGDPDAQQPFARSGGETAEQKGFDRYPDDGRPDQQEG